MSKKTSAPTIFVPGSINLDFVLTAPHLPAPGETVIGATMQRFPGGKGANQALAARRLGADVVFAGCLGQDAFADEALALLKSDGVDLTACTYLADHPTGTAFIAVSEDGENQIVVASGANLAFTPDRLETPKADGVICQLEIPMETILAAAKAAEGLFCLNAAPAGAVPEAVLKRTDLLVVNEGEAKALGARLNEFGNLLAITLGARGAILMKDGREIAKATPPAVSVVDTTGAGDTFTAALALALVEGRAPEEALTRACAAGALATTQKGAQSSIPYAKTVEALLAAP